jgi:hypothetical protein
VTLGSRVAVGVRVDGTAVSVGVSVGGTGAGEVQAARSVSRLALRVAEAIQVQRRCFALNIPPL